MYCSKCGEADKNENIYCRKCGSFRLDSLKKEMTILLITNFVIFFCFFAWLLILIWGKIYEYMGGSPVDQSVAYYGMFFSLIVTVFSNLLFFFGVLRKIRKTSISVNTKTKDLNTEPNNLETKDLLPSADFQNVVPSVVEETTRNLEKVRRNN
jgi:fatty acid desaturase